MGPHTNVVLVGPGALHICLNSSVSRRPASAESFELTAPVLCARRIVRSARKDTSVLIDHTTGGHGCVKRQSPVLTDRTVWICETLQPIIIHGGDATWREGGPLDPNVPIFTVRRLGTYADTRGPCTAGSPWDLGTNENASIGQAGMGCVLDDMQLRSVVRAVRADPNILLAIRAVRIRGTHSGPYMVGRRRVHLPLTIRR